MGENENICIKSSKANRCVLSLSRVADNGSINERTMMDGFVDYVSINKRSRSRMYRMGCTKFTFEERLINVFAFLIYIRDSYVGHILLIPSIICPDTEASN